MDARDQCSMLELGSSTLSHEHPSTSRKIEIGPLAEPYLSDEEQCESVRHKTSMDILFIKLGLA